MLMSFSLAVLKQDSLSCTGLKYWATNVDSVEMYGIPEYKGEIGKNLLPNSRRTMGTAIMAWTGLPLKDRSNRWRAEHQSLIEQGKNRNKAFHDKPRDTFHHSDKRKCNVPGWKPDVPCTHTNRDWTNQLGSHLRKLLLISSMLHYQITHNRYCHFKMG